MTCSVFDQQRGVDMILATQQADAADGGFCAFSGKADETLVTHQLGITGKGETVEMGARADRGEQAPDMQSSSPRNLDVVDLRPIAHHQLKRGIDLRIAALVALHNGDLGALLHHDQRPDKRRRWPVATRRENEISAA